MKYLKYFESNKSIESICKKYGIENYTINEDGTVDVNGDVYLNSKGLKEIPLKFGYVSGDFFCDYNGLISLEGAPSEVGGYFSCCYNQLASLEGAPRKVGECFGCHNNQLTSLIGSPEKIGEDFHCNDNELTSLIGAPEEIGGNFYCADNPLPKEILDNYEYINRIVKYQSDYNIWRRDGALDTYRFSDMMKEILEEQK